VTQSKHFTKRGRLQPRHGFLKKAICLLALCLVSSPALAAECEIIFYDLASTVDGQAGVSNDAICSKLRNAIVSQTSARFASSSRMEMKEGDGQNHCVVHTNPGELPRDLLDVYRFRVGNIVSRTAGADYTNWRISCN